jgi:hypothetical protein
MLSSLYERDIVTFKLHDDMLKFISACDIAPFNEIVKYIKSIKPVSSQKLCRKLVALADYEGKTRVIAIGDYLSNMLLKPLHDKLMACLKGLSSDYTFRQHTLSTVQLKDGEEPVSVDITAATDRIPSDITAKVISEYFSAPDIGVG